MQHLQVTYVVQSSHTDEHQDPQDAASSTGWALEGLSKSSLEATDTGTAMPGDSSADTAIQAQGIPSFTNRDMSSGLTAIQGAASILLADHLLKPQADWHVCPPPPLMTKPQENGPGDLPPRRNSRRTIIT